MHITPLPALEDNYIWLLCDAKYALVIDPSDSRVVGDFLSQQGLTLVAILVTHHHQDHTAGIVALLKRYPGIPVYGPSTPDITGLTHPLGEGSRITVPQLPVQFDTLAVPGHTTSHLSFYSEQAGILFPGDTLFSAGCGRLFGGTAAQLFHSLQRLAALPPQTAVYPAHEYTLANLAFAAVAEPHNPERDAWRAHCQRERGENRPTLPSSIARERAINPFLRTAHCSIIEAVTTHSGQRPRDELSCFTALRSWKDHFRG